MAWLHLLFERLLEIGRPVGLKTVQGPALRWAGAVLAMAFVAASGFMLRTAQRQILTGTACAAWAGIGTGATFLAGVTVFGGIGSAGCFPGVVTTVGGVVVSEVASG